MDLPKGMMATASEFLAGGTLLMIVATVRGEQLTSMPTPGAVAALIWDGAGWHQPGGELVVPDNIVLLSLPPYAILPRTHRLARARKVSLADLLPEPYVMLDLPHSREYFAALFDAVGSRPVPANIQPQSDTNGKRNALIVAAIVTACPA